MDSGFVYKSIFPEIEDGKRTIQFVEDAGTKYRFQIISRRIDSFSKIDFTPEGINGVTPEGARMSGVKFEKKEDYFKHTFHYARPSNSESVNIEFGGVNVNGLKPNELVIYIFKEL